MLRKNLLIILLLFFSFSIFANIDQSDDPEKQEDTSWVNNFINIDPSDDIFYGFSPKKFAISKDYVKKLAWRQNIDLFVDAIDEHNLRQNINILPRFPYVFMLYGGYSYNRGFDVGFLFRADNIANLNTSFTTAFSYGQKGKLWLHLNVENYSLFNKRVKLLGTMSLFSTSLQYASQVNSYTESSNIISKLFDKVWGAFGIDQFYKRNEIGFDFLSGVDLRVPFVETDVIALLEIMYRYDFEKIIGVKEIYTDDDPDYSDPPDLLRPRQRYVNLSNLNFNLQLELRWDQFEQTSTIPVGNNLSLFTKFYLPTTVGLNNQEFRFKSRIEERLNYKLFREFAFKGRLLLAANYNISEDFSGDPYIRGMADQELTGWFALLANLELYIPIVNIEIKGGPIKPYKKEGRFILYWVFFADGGFTIENYNNYLEGFVDRMPRNYINNSPFFYNDESGNYLGPAQGGQIFLGEDNYLLPAVTAGSGIHIYPYFLHFIFRLDVGVNILKAAIYRNQPAECIEVVVSFSQTF